MWYNEARVSYGGVLIGSDRTIGEYFLRQLGMLSGLAGHIPMLGCVVAKGAGSYLQSISSLY